MSSTPDYKPEDHKEREPSQEGSALGRLILQVALIAIGVSLINAGCQHLGAALQ